MGALFYIIESVSFGYKNATDGVYVGWHPVRDNSLANTLELEKDARTKKVLAYDDLMLANLPAACRNLKK